MSHKVKLSRSYQKAHTVQKTVTEGKVWQRTNDQQRYRLVDLTEHDGLHYEQVGESLQSTFQWGEGTG